MAAVIAPAAASGRSNSLQDRVMKSSTTCGSSLIRSFTKGKTADEIRDGKFFHIRVTVGYLTCLNSEEVPNTPCASGEDPMITASVSFGLSDKDRGEYDFATSYPITRGNPRQNVKWPKGEDVKTSKRRLYYSVLLRSDDSMLPPESNITFDDDDSVAIRTPTPFVPELLNLYICLNCGDESVIIGASTLVLTGSVVENQHIDLPVRKVSFVTKKRSTENPEQHHGRGSRLKKLFGKAGNSMQKSDLNCSTFKRGNKRYSLCKNSILHVKLDVMEGLYQTNGPGLWGDLEDDEESFGPVPVIDIPDDCTNDLTERYKHESIEVFAYRKGTTIISSPGCGEAEEMKEKSKKKSRKGNKKRSPKLDDYLSESGLTKEPFLLCGQADLVSDLNMTASTTQGDEDSMSFTESEGDNSSSMSSQDENAKTSRSTVSKSLHPKTFERGISAIEEGVELGEGSVSVQSSSKFGQKDKDEINSSRSEVRDATATNTLLRYASRMGIPIEEILEAVGRDDDDTDSQGSSTFSSKGTGTLSGYPGNTTYPGDLTRESALASGTLSTYSGGDQSSTYNDSTVDGSDASESLNKNWWFR